MPHSESSFQLKRCAVGIASQVTATRYYSEFLNSLYIFRTPQLLRHRLTVSYATSVNLFSDFTITDNSTKAKRPAFFGGGMSGFRQQGVR